MTMMKKNMHAAMIGTKFVRVEAVLSAEIVIAKLKILAIFLKTTTTKNESIRREKMTANAEKPYKYTVTFRDGKRSAEIILAHQINETESFVTFVWWKGDEYHEYRLAVAVIESIATEPNFEAKADA